MINEYHKIPDISPGLILFQRHLVGGGGGGITGGLTSGGAYNGGEGILHQRKGVILSAKKLLS